VSFLDVVGIMLLLALAAVAARRRILQRRRDLEVTRHRQPAGGETLALPEVPS